MHVGNGIGEARRLDIQNTRDTHSVAFLAQCICSMLLSLIPLFSKLAPHQRLLTRSTKHNDLGTCSVSTLSNMLTLELNY